MCRLRQLCCPKGEDRRSESIPPVPVVPFFVLGAIL
jgi:hypothetical protein